MKTIEICGHVVGKQRHVLNIWNGSCFWWKSQSELQNRKQTTNESEAQGINSWVIASGRGGNGVALQNIACKAKNSKNLKCCKAGNSTNLKRETIEICVHGAITSATK